VTACTCTTGPECSRCRPPCRWVTSHLGEIAVRCGDTYFTHLSVDLPVCVDHFQYSRLDADDELFVNLAGAW
jgi:hypothetical protein